MTDRRATVQRTSGGQSGFTRFVALFLFSVLSLLAWKPVSASSTISDALEICGKEWPNYEAWTHALESNGWRELSREEAEAWVPRFTIGFAGSQIEDLLRNDAHLLHFFAEIELSKNYQQNLNVQGPTWWGHVELQEIALRASTQRATGQDDRMATCIVVSQNTSEFDNVVAQPNQPTSESKGAYVTNQVFQWTLANDRTMSVIKRTFSFPDNLDPSLVTAWPAVAIQTVTFWSNQ